MVVDAVENAWSSWNSYRPRSMRVYGTICVSPAGRFLLVRGLKTGKWSFPKGHLKYGELGQECALRELKEETGLTLPFYSYFRVLELFKQNEYFCYQIQEMEPTPQDTSEISAAGWFSTEEMERMEVNADIKRFLRTKVRF
jgi:ADP-ribose pyrophosphatase YjhB (NUDIX family)